MLRINKLSVKYKGRSTPAIKAVDLAIKRGEFTGLVGESGSGKSTVANSVLNILPESAEKEGDFLFAGQKLNRALEEKFRKNKIAYIGQNFYKSLSEFFTLETHFRYFYKSIFNKKAKKCDLQNFIELLEVLKLEKPDKLIKSYPFELSGGMLQRLSIAFSLLKEPELLIADEPTSAIDMMAKQEFIKLIKNISQERDMSVLMISHDLNLIFEFCDSVYVMYKGKVIEYGNSQKLFDDTAHPYTRLLIDSNEPVRFSENLQNQNSCVFSTYCPYYKSECSDKIRKVSEDHYVACRGVKNAGS